MLPLSFQIVPMLAHHNDATAAEVLAFLSVFLYDGNERVQVRLMCVFTCVGGGLWSLCCWQQFVHLVSLIIYSCALSHTHSCTHVLMHTCTHALVHTCTHALIHSCTHAHIHTCTHAHMYSCTHALTHTCTHAHMHPCTHAWHLLTNMLRLALHTWLRPGRSGSLSTSERGLTMQWPLTQRGVGCVVLCMFSEKVP